MKTIKSITSAAILELTLAQLNFIDGLYWNDEKLSIQEKIENFMVGCVVSFNDPEEVLKSVKIADLADLDDVDDLLETAKSLDLYFGPSIEVLEYFKRELENKK